MPGRQILVFAIALAACGPRGQVATITIAPLEASVQAGETLQYGAAAFDSDGRRLGGVTFTWTTAPPGVVSVDENGLVTTLQPGFASVLASFDGVSSERATLSVLGPAEPPRRPERPVVEAGLRTVTVTWMPVAATPAVTSYTVYAAHAPWNTFSAALPGATLQAGLACCSATFELPAGTTYAFAVTATNAAGESLLSERVTATASGLAIAWASRARMPTPRAELGVAVVDGQLYAVGGESGSRLSTVERYAPATDTWTARAPMPTPRAGLAVVALDGKIYAVGGRTSGDPNQPLSTVNEVYDPASDTWTTAAPLPAVPGRACDNTAGAAVGGKLYVWSGQCVSPPAGQLWEYEPSTDAWTPRGETPFELVHGHRLVSDGARLFALVPSVSMVSAWSPGPGTWSNLSPLDTSSSTGLIGFDALAATADALFAFGVSDRRFPIVLTNHARYYDAGSQAWLWTTPMSIPRKDFATATLGDQVFAVGGADPASMNTVPLDWLEVGTVVR